MIERIGRCILTKPKRSNEKKIPRNINIAAGLFISLRQACQAPKPDLENRLDQIPEDYGQNGGERLIAAFIKADGGHKQWLQNEVPQFHWSYHLNDRRPNIRIEYLQRRIPARWKRCKKSKVKTYTSVGQEMKLGPCQRMHRGSLIQDSRPLHPAILWDSHLYLRTSTRILKNLQKTAILRESVINTST